MEFSGALLVAIGVLFLVGIYIFRPLLFPKQVIDRPMTQREKLTQQKNLLLDEVQSLDFDHDTGNISEETHRQQRVGLMQQAADLLRQLEALPENSDHTEQIEQLISSLRKNQ